MSYKKPKKNEKIIRKEISKEEALALFKNNFYKEEIIKYMDNIVL